MGASPPWKVKERDEDDDNDEIDIMKSVDYTCGLIDEEVEETKLPLENIFVGGFSQGCAISRLAALRSKPAGELGGVIGHSVYLPSEQTVTKSLEARGRFREQPTRHLLAHGSRDHLVRRTVFTSYREKVEDWFGDKADTRM